MPLIQNDIMRQRLEFVKQKDTRQSKRHRNSVVLSKCVCYLREVYLVYVKGLGFVDSRAAVIVAGSSAHVPRSALDTSWLSGAELSSSVPRRRSSRRRALCGGGQLVGAGARSSATHIKDTSSELFLISSRLLVEALLSKEKLINGVGQNS